MVRLRAGERVPERGDAVWISHDPQAGYEQAGRRPALVLSPSTYNRKVGLALMCPITNQAKGYPFEVVIPAGLAVTGVISADQVKSLDWRKHRAEFIGRIPEATILEVAPKTKDVVAWHHAMIPARATHPGHRRLRHRSVGPIDGVKPMAKIAFLFPGQGAQSVGMCRELDQELPAVREMFDRAGELLGIDLRRLCIEGPAEALEATDVSQPAIFVASLAALESLKQSNPDLVASCEGAAGLSLGEYTALVFAGAMDFEAGLQVVRRRGQAMQAAAVATPSGMTSVLGLDEPAVDELCRRVAPSGRLWKANLLGPGNIVVSGEVSALSQVAAVATELGAMKVVPLAVAGAFHSELMKPADDQLAQVLSQTPSAHRAFPSTRMLTPPHTPTRTTSAVRSWPRSSRGFAGKTRCDG